MQLPEQPPPPLAPLWDRVQRARALPPDLDVHLLYVAIRGRLAHAEPEVRLHALRVLADLLPLAGSALAFPFDQVVDNLGHTSPNVRKAALDALKVFCHHCEDVECAAKAILDKCYYHNIRPQSPGIDSKVNVITGLILSIPSVMGILKRRHQDLDLFPVFQILGEKLFDPVHRDVAHRAMMKLRKISGPRDYTSALLRLDPKIQEKFKYLCDHFDEDSLDVYYAPRKTLFHENNQPLMTFNQVFNNSYNGPIRLSTDTSSEDSFATRPYNNNFAKVIIETEIKFDSDTAITMTVLEENETESERQTASDDDYDSSSDRNMLKYSDGDSEDTDVVVKKVRFGGESVKIRTPDSDNIISSEDDVNHNFRGRAVPIIKDNIEEVSKSVSTPAIMNRMNETKHDIYERESHIKSKKSAIPLPVIKNKVTQNVTSKYSGVKLKSKSLSELYDYFNCKNETRDDKTKEFDGFALTISEVHSPDKVPSPVESHREVEVLHNLQRSPAVSPRRQRTRVVLEKDGFVLNLLASSPPPPEDLVSPRAPTPLRARYDWEELEIVPQYIAEQLHNTENWIAAVKGADQLHSALLESATVRKLEPAALSLIKHMWALTDAVPAAKAPAEGAVCAVIRGASAECARQLLPALVARLARKPLPAALPHALLQRLALHHLIDLIFDPSIIGVLDNAEETEEAQLRAALCVARAAGPAAVLAAVRRRLAGTSRADRFYNKLRERLNRPLENIKPIHIVRSSQLPVPVRRRARSTPPPAATPAPRRLRPLPDSAPLPGTLPQPGRQYYLKRLSPIPLSDRESNGPLGYDEKDTNVEDNVEKRAIDGIIVDGGFDGGDDGEDAQTDSRHASRSSRHASRSPSPAARSLSIRVEDYSEKSDKASFSSSETLTKSPTKEPPFGEVISLNSSAPSGEEGFEPRTPGAHSQSTAAASRAASRVSSPIPSPTGSRAPSAPRTPEPVDQRPDPQETRDVRTALAECVLPLRHEDWEAIVAALNETERLATDPTARAPASSWRAAVRNAAHHVRSLRSRVARAACRTMAALFEHRGRALDPELEEAAGALLERCADVNRFLRADAASALTCVASGGSTARGVAALVRRGASHRAGPVRAAAAAALARLVRRGGALDLPPEPRALLLRAAGELLGDASPETRLHARHLCLVLSEDSRFDALLKEAMPPSRYRSVEKLVEKLRYR